MSSRITASSELSQDLHRRVRLLTVEKLKKILRGAGLTVTGNKANLVERIITELNHRLQTNDAEKFTRLRQAIQNPDASSSFLARSAPALDPPKSGIGPQFGSVRISAPTNTGYVTSFPSSLESSNAVLSFRSSPFYNIQETLSSRKTLVAREQSRDTLDFAFRIRGDILERMRRDHRLKVLLYSGADEALAGPSQITFPSNFELKVNSIEVKANFKGLKNKPGTTRPVDITACVSKSASQDNHVWLTWAITRIRYHLSIYLVRQHDASELVQKLGEAKRISQASVLREMSTWAGDNDLVATSSRMSLKCPLSTLRIQTPCRSQICKHNQCFDALSFLQLQEQAPQWSCPVCNKYVPFEILQIDEYVDSILKSTPTSAEQVTVEPNGHWSLITDNQDNSSTPARILKREESLGSDDIVEITEISSKSPNQQTATGALNVNSADSNNFSSPLPSTSLKRPAPDVIDLTLDSDDDDENPQAQTPSKRQMVDTSNSFPWEHPSYRGASGETAFERRISLTIPSKPNPIAPGSRFPS